jgi:hypothetical protein
MCQFLVDRRSFSQLPLSVATPFSLSFSLALFYVLQSLLLLLSHLLFPLKKGITEGEKTGIRNDLLPIAHHRTPPAIWYKMLEAFIFQYEFERAAQLCIYDFRCCHGDATHQTLKSWCSQISSLDFRTRFSSARNHFLPPHTNIILYSPLPSSRLEYSPFGWKKKNRSARCGVALVCLYSCPSDLTLYYPSP